MNWVTNHQNNNYILQIYFTAALKITEMSFQIYR